MAVKVLSACFLFYSLRFSLLVYYITASNVIFIFYLLCSITIVLYFTPVWSTCNNTYTVRYSLSPNPHAPWCLLSEIAFGTKGLFSSTDRYIQMYRKALYNGIWFILVFIFVTKTAYVKALKNSARWLLATGPPFSPCPPPEFFVISKVTSCDTSPATHPLFLPLSRPGYPMSEGLVIYRVTSRWYREAGHWERDTQRTLYVSSY